MKQPPLPPSPNLLPSPRRISIMTWNVFALKTFWKKACFFFVFFIYLFGDPDLKHLFVFERRMGFDVKPL